MTAIAGFGVLVLSDIAMLRDFGLVTLIDLSVSLVGVLVALPAALCWRSAEPGAAAYRCRAQAHGWRAHGPKGGSGHEPV